ncbi:hypothetical protein PFICI_09141 [Pestalotiopsis fici W106-1]|uniref:FAD-binding FR-type domain-containing protein n=1 Tax=Pestalotiopsis fici (strain W106-1 / CGMCC3.15140) TaxID=1229662 RepID=W3WZJ1_PESFW|nr:uncharacterized protein PFICI_09141 [Pestalotiopsis fici W106-1]ETS79288.1 hypothetical protein PFICI_09141 [Pestalotiopsis fici W106-1]
MAGDVPSAKQLDNEWSAKVYAYILCGLIAVFIVDRWASFILGKQFRQDSASGNWSSVYFYLKSFYLKLRRVVVRSCLGFPSVGHAILVAIYVIINVILTFVHLEYDKTNYYAARFGWMATANFAFIVFLALKNTPLAFLTKYSYERLNFLHRVAGYTTVLFMLLHTAAYIRHEVAKNKLEKLIEIDNVCGIVAGCAMLVIAMTALLFMERTYELFYVAHITLFIVATIATGLHRPEWIDRIPIVMILIAGAWTLDRLTRFAWMVARSINNEARLEALPSGGTKVILKKSLKNAAPGTHCFLWIPRAQLFETHPFTIVSNGPDGLELVAKAHDGFTKSLNELANKEGKQVSLYASVDGPYGTCPNPSAYDRLVLVVGGTGATFAFGMIMDLLQRQSEQDSKLQIHLVWAVRHVDDVAWAADHVRALRAYGSRVCLGIYVTQDRPLASNSDGLEESTNTTALDLFQYFTVYEGTERSLPPTGEKHGQNENAASTDDLDGWIQESKQEGATVWALVYGKLRLNKILPELVAGANVNQRILIGVCGPTGMTATSRDVVSPLMQPNGPSIDLHCESFGW